MSATTPPGRRHQPRKISSSPKVSRAWTYSTIFGCFRSRYRCSATRSIGRANTGYPCRATLPRQTPPHRHRRRLKSNKERASPTTSSLCLQRRSPEGNFVYRALLRGRPSSRTYQVYFAGSPQRNASSKASRKQTKLREQQREGSPRVPRVRATSILRMPALK